MAFEKKSDECAIRLDAVALKMIALRRIPDKVGDLLRAQPRQGEAIAFCVYVVLFLQCAKELLLSPLCGENRRQRGDACK